MKKTSHKKVYILSIILVFICSIMFSACGLSKEEQALYDEVLNLSLEQISPQNWKYTGKTYSWSLESPDYHNQFFFYIDEDIYDDYKSYWLEGIPKEMYKRGFNNDLYLYGEYVQHCINITSHIYDEEFNLFVDLYAGKDAPRFKVSIYDKSLFYIYTKPQHSDGSIIRDSGYDIDRESCIAQMYFYKQNDEWIMKEISEDNKDN